MVGSGVNSVECRWKSLDWRRAHFPFCIEACECERLREAEGRRRNSEEVGELVYL
jgi:hypothetical protein